MNRLSPRQLAALEAVSEGRFFPELRREEDGWHARWRGFGEDNPWIDEYVRAAAASPLCEDAEHQRHETLHDAWLMALRSGTGLVVWDDAECERFAGELRDWSGAAEEDAAARAGICFRLESDERGFRLACGVPRGRRALKALGQAAYVFGALRGLRSDGAGSLSVGLSRAEAESFVRSGAKELSDAGYSVSGCDVYASVSAGAEIEGGEAPGDAGGGDAADSDARHRLKLVVRVAGEAVDAEELRFLLEQKSSLVFFRDRWIEVDRNILKEALRALERQDGRKLTVNEAVAFACGIGFAGRLDVEEASAHGWLRGLVNELRSRGGDDAIPSASSLDTPGLALPLLPYQRRGTAWMKFLSEHGFGALLADDMGLGKTAQTIAWILAERAGGAVEGPFLVVAPLTLLANWRHEFAKFAPGLASYVHQGERRQLEAGFRRAAEKADVVITSYSLLVKDHSAIRGVRWGGLVLDEAQAVKNPDSQAARAAFALGAPRRVALTGTPVENSVVDVWSIENILNPGFLGDRKSFADRFVKPLAADEKSAAGRRLTHALEPFVLRRLKSDADIAGELGPKREIKEFCVLSPAQRRDYEAALEDYRAGERRQGDVFALLTRLKLVCDGDGKFERLGDLLDGIFAAGESALVFTQYARVGAEIVRFLGERYGGRKFPFLHGSLDAKGREAEVAAFNGSTDPTAFVLSLRAGGYGLNLTKATHVVHFDRWWNPAVEAQATDRAHRIGQAKTVFVHSFITEGTLEERVDELLERKSRIAGTLVASGEKFLRELSPSEFDDAVRLWTPG